MMNFYNPVLQARFLELGERGGGRCTQATHHKLTHQLSFTPKATNTGFVLNIIFSKKPFAILYLNATRAFTEVS